MKFKKGEMSTQQIILLIVLITSFIVVLFFLVRLNLGEESRSQLCHDSVIRKSSVLSEAPLQCYRDYVCITQDGTCEELIDPKKVRIKNLDETYQALAEEMSNCWWLFGEGKVNYVGDGFIKDNYCSICSQIYLDDSLNNIEGIEEGKISKDGLYDYLADNEISEGETYLEYLVGISDPNTLKEQVVSDEGDAGKVTFGSIEIGKQYFNVMGIISEVSKWKVVTVGVVAGAVLLPLAVGSAAVGVIVLGAGSGAAVGVAGSEVSELFEPEIGGITVEGDGIPNRFLTPTIQEADLDKFNSLNCEEILTYT